MAIDLAGAQQKMLVDVKYYDQELVAEIRLMWMACT